MGLRESGNAACKAGQLRQALDLYWQAARQNPQDFAVFNNISVTALRLGDAREMRERGWDQGSGSNLWQALGVEGGGGCRVTQADGGPWAV